MDKQKTMGKFGYLTVRLPLSCIFTGVVLFLLFAQTAMCSEKKVELILDASGSMNSKLKSGERKIDAAKNAIEKLVRDITPNTVLAFRAYGHRSHKNKKDCLDTELLVNFAPVSENRNQITTKANALKAQGYTPITYVLGLAAKDFPPNDEAEHIIVLVSDGKETCKGDPCATAKSLYEAGIFRLVIHTVGFGVDDATRNQLECIARVSGGRYFSATNTGELVSALNTAVEVAPKSETETVIIVKKNKAPGFLKIVSPDLAGHDVIDAVTGEKVGSVSRLSTGSGISLKEGIYNVTIGAGLWKSIEVKAGETTVISPGRLTIRSAGIMRIDILDAETGKKHGSVSKSNNTMALMPGLYDVVFHGGAVWPVEIKEGETKILQPGTVKVVNSGVNFLHIRNSEGRKVGHVSNSLSSIPLPPGEYTIKIDGEEYPFSLKEAETKTFKLQ